MERLGVHERGAQTADKGQWHVSYDLKIVPVV